MVRCDEDDSHALPKRRINEDVTAIDIVSTYSLHSIQYSAMYPYTSAQKDKWPVNRRDGSFIGNSDTTNFPPSENAKSDLIWTTSGKIPTKWPQFGHRAINNVLPFDPQCQWLCAVQLNVDLSIAVVHCQLSTIAVSLTPSQRH